jgi:hypothetical protein
MTKLPVLLLLAAIGRATSAQTPVTVDQFEKLLATLRDQRDGKAAKQLAGLELTERASSPRLARWETDFKGEHTRQVLTAVADRSAFLSLPAAELPSAANPDLASQRKMMSLTLDYVNRTLHKLPNFFALRTTIRFEVGTAAQLHLQKQAQLDVLNDSLNNSWNEHRSQELGSRAGSKGAQLYFEGTFNRLETYRDGQEVADSPSQGGKRSKPPPPGLTTNGEFGPILYVVLGDAARGKVEWDHWEQGVSGLLAVFRYRVPREISRYGIVSAVDGRREFPAYRGEIAVDPESGAILRITIESQAPPSNSVSESDILVEYGPVVIGGSTYICPVRGVAISKEPTGRAEGSTTTAPAPLLTEVNDVSFSGYHLFRSEVRILP